MSPKLAVLAGNKTNHAQDLNEIPLNHPSNKQVGSASKPDDTHLLQWLPLASLSLSLFILSLSFLGEPRTYA